MDRMSAGRILAVALVLCWIVSCKETGVSGSSSDDSSATETTNLAADTSGAVVFSRLADASVLITVPASLLGGEVGVQQSLVSVFVNGKASQRFFGQNLFALPGGKVRFSIGPVADGDAVHVVIMPSFGPSVIYGGTVSSGSETTASVVSSIEAEASSSAGTVLVTFGMVGADATSAVTIPLSAVGDSVDGVTLDVKIGSTEITGLEASEYYDSTDQRIEFTLTGVASGDEIEITLNLADGSSMTISATLSDFADVTESVETAASGDGADETGDEDDTGDEGGSTAQAVFGEINENGYSMIHLPLAVFGSDSSDVEGATFDAAVGSTTIGSAIEASSYYESSDEEVQFYLTSLSSGDAVTVTVHLSDGTTVVFSGTVSDSGDTTVDAQ